MNDVSVTRELQHLRTLHWLGLTLANPTEQPLDTRRHPPPSRSRRSPLVCSSASRTALRPRTCTRQPVTPQPCTHRPTSTRQRLGTDQEGPQPSPRPSASQGDGRTAKAGPSDDPLLARERGHRGHAAVKPDSRRRRGSTRHRRKRGGGRRVGAGDGEGRDGGSCAAVSVPHASHAAPCPSRSRQPYLTAACTSPPYSHSEQPRAAASLHPAAQRRPRGRHSAPTSKTPTSPRCAAGRCLTSGQII